MADVPEEVRKYMSKLGKKSPTKFTSESASRASKAGWAKRRAKAKENAKQ